MVTVMLCPRGTTGFVWLKVTAVEFTVVALALIIPQSLISVLQTVIDAAPLVLAAERVTTEPLKLACIALVLELFEIRYTPDPPLTVTGIDCPETTEKLFWLKVNCWALEFCTVTVTLAQFEALPTTQILMTVEP